MWSRTCRAAAARAPWRRLATSKPDGSIFYATTPTYIYTSLMSKPQHTYRDLEPLVNFFTDAEVLYTRADGPFKTLQDVIAHAKDKRGRWGVANPASLERQAAERLKAAAGVNAAVVSHEGGGDLMINVLNGTLEIGVGEIQELRSQLEGKKVRLLATFNDERLTDFPDVPTVKEAGYDVVAEEIPRSRRRRRACRRRSSPPGKRRCRNSLPTRTIKKVYGAESLVADFVPHAAYVKFIDEFGRSSESFLKETGVLK